MLTQGSDIGSLRVVNARRELESASGLEKGNTCRAIA